MPKKRKRKELTTRQRWLGFGAILALTFVFGTIMGHFQGPGHMVWVTETVGFSPHSEPYYNGLMWVCVVLSLYFATWFGLYLVMRLLRGGYFFVFGGGLMLLMAVTALSLAIFGEPPEFDFETSQRITFVVIGCMFGFFGGWSVWRGFPRREEPKTRGRSQKKNGL